MHIHAHAHAWYVTHAHAHAHTHTHTHTYTYTCTRGTARTYACTQYRHVLLRIHDTFTSAHTAAFAHRCDVSDTTSPYEHPTFMHLI